MKKIILLEGSVHTLINLGGLNALKELMDEEGCYEAVVSSYDITLTGSNASEICASYGATFTDSPIGEPVAAYDVRQLNYTFMTESGIHVCVYVNDWQEIALEGGDYYSMCITDMGEWTFYPSAAVENEKLRYYTIDNEEIETRLLAAV